MLFVVGLVIIYVVSDHLSERILPNGWKPPSLLRQIKSLRAILETNKQITDWGDQRKIAEHMTEPIMTKLGIVDALKKFFVKGTVAILIAIPLIYVWFEFYINYLN